MKKISFFISIFVIVGCSTPEIRIPSYNLNTFQASKHKVKTSKTTQKHIVPIKEYNTSHKKEESSTGFFSKLMSLKPRMRKIHFKERTSISYEEKETTSITPLPFEKPVIKMETSTKHKTRKMKYKKRKLKKQSDEFGSLLTKKLKMTSKKRYIEDYQEHALPQIEDTKQSQTKKKKEKKSENMFSSLLKKTTKSFSNLFKRGSRVKKEYYTGGKLRSKFVMNDTSEESGLLYKYGYEGKVISTAHIKHGLKNGLETLYNNEGKILKRTLYVNGKKDGIVEVYYPNGKVLAQITYKNNIREGRASKYNKDGSVNEEVEFRHGRLIIDDDDLAIPTID